MIHFYKPNAKVTGTACSFWYNTNEKSFFSSMIKQASWDSSKRQGSFVKNKQVPDKNVIVKFSAAEIGGILDSIETNREFSTYHSSKNQITKIKFGKYERDGKQIGFSYGVNKENKEDSTDKSSFIIGFTFGEARLLKQYLMKALDSSFSFYTPKEEGETQTQTKEVDSFDSW
tara:strand:- start:405 stop:923 length:519 start_codon:yes stop_codon:yes gene_type:complete